MQTDKFSTEKYIIEIDHEKKIISMEFFGDSNKEEVEQFHQTYLNEIIPLKTEEYLLLLNSLSMEIPDTKRLHEMQVSFALYRKSGFKEICFIFANDEFRKSMQRLIGFSGMSNISDVTLTTPDEVDDVIQRHIESTKD